MSEILEEYAKGLTVPNLSSYIHGKVRQTPTHIPITELVNATRRAGQCSVTGRGVREAEAVVDLRRDELGAVIAKMWERMCKAEARVEELSRPPESQ